MPSNSYAILGIFVLASFGVAILAALWVDTTTVPEFVGEYAVRVFVTVLIIGGAAVIIDKYR